jgi:hypothetical protein
MDEKQFSALMHRLDTVSKLLAFNIISNKSVSEQVEILTKAGVKASDIADILGKTENQIYVTQSLLRKKKKESLAEAVEQLSLTQKTEGDTNDR